MIPLLALLFKLAACWRFGERSRESVRSWCSCQKKIVVLDGSLPVNDASWPYTGRMSELHQAVLGPPPFLTANRIVARNSSQKQGLGSLFRDALCPFRREKQRIFNAESSLFKMICKVHRGFTQDLHRFPSLLN